MASHLSPFQFHSQSRQFPLPDRRYSPFHSFAESRSFLRFAYYSLSVRSIWREFDTLEGWTVQDLWIRTSQEELFLRELFRLVRRVGSDDRLLRGGSLIWRGAFRFRSQLEICLLTGRTELNAELNDTLGVDSIRSLSFGWKIGSSRSSCDIK